MFDNLFITIFLPMKKIALLFVAGLVLMGCNMAGKTGGKVNLPTVAVLPYLLIFFIIALVALIVFLISQQRKNRKKKKSQYNSISEQVIIDMLLDKLKNIEFLDEELTLIRKHDANNAASKPGLIKVEDFLRKVFEKIIENQNKSKKESENWDTISEIVKSEIPGLVNSKDIISIVKASVLSYNEAFSKVLVKQMKDGLSHQESPLTISNVQPDLPAKIEPVTSIQKTLDEPTLGTKFYFNNPVKGGFFIDEQKTMFRSQETLFEFSLNSENPRESSFFLNPSPDAIPSAINFYTIKVEPVCDIENLQETHHKRIQHVKAGRARLEDGKWIIINRAKARFE